MHVRARFYVAEVTQQGYNGKGSGQGKIVLRATTRKDGENKEFWEATPSGTLELYLSAKGGEAFRLLNDRIGQDVYLDLSDTPETEAGKQFFDQYSKTPVGESAKATD